LKRIEERRETGAHQRWRNLPEMLADAAGTGEEFWRPGGTICRGRKGEMERRCGATYRSGAGEETAGQ
jgi:hypothetical protein